MTAQQAAARRLMHETADWSGQPELLGLFFRHELFSVC